MAEAATICRSPSLSPNYVPSLQSKHLSRVFMVKPAKNSHNRSLKLQIITSSCIKNKLVLEDRSLGVICYRDDDGEIICEGYDDEEPRIMEQQIDKFWESLPSFGSDGDIKILQQSRALTKLVIK